MQPYHAWPPPFHMLPTPLSYQTKYIHIIVSLEIFMLYMYRYVCIRSHYVCTYWIYVYVYLTANISYDVTYTSSRDEIKSCDSSSASIIISNGEFT